MIVEVVVGLIMNEIVEVNLVWSDCFTRWWGWVMEWMVENQRVYHDLDFGICLGYGGCGGDFNHE